MLLGDTKSTQSGGLDEGENSEDSQEYRHRDFTPKFPKLNGGKECVKMIVRYGFNVDRAYWDGLRVGC